MDERQTCIDDIVRALEALRTAEACADREAVEANLEFFQAARTLSGYLAWLLLRAWRLQPTTLLELTDFGFPRWDQAMHSKLIEVERRPFPGLITPLVERVVQVVSTAQRPLVLVDLGCGSMEVERQVLQRLLTNAPRQPVVFVGIEKSSAVQALAMENLRPLRPQVDVRQAEIIGREELEELMKQRTSPFLVVLCRNDVFGLDQTFPAGWFDVVFHSLFAHHLTRGDRERVLSVARKVAKRVIEYDALRSWGLMLPQSLTGWQSPVFLNAAIFSNLRCCRKRDVRRRVARGGGQLSFHLLPGTYLLEHPVSQTNSQQQQWVSAGNGHEQGH
jgi:hypothetical protein